mmetsp:Transcript_9312/g.27316  ORF Transcript_9312/g.27316 Transcript_9312/m.27316 type:complete len:212 (+) Transcript_9312:618-1253(+)
MTRGWNARQILQHPIKKLGHAGQKPLRAFGNSTAAEQVDGRRAHDGPVDDPEAQHVFTLRVAVPGVPSVLEDVVHDQHVPENSHQDVVDERPGLAIRSHPIEELREQVLLLRRRGRRISRDARALTAGLHRNRGVVLVSARHLQDGVEEVSLIETCLTTIRGQEVLDMCPGDLIHVILANPGLLFRAIDAVGVERQRPFIVGARPIVHHPL